jgi:hypothetical protein
MQLENGWPISAAFAARLMRAGYDAEQLTKRHLERAQQCCMELSSSDSLAVSSRVLVAYLALLHDALAVLAHRGWQVSPDEGQADDEVLEALIRLAALKPQLACAVRFAAATRHAELEGLLPLEKQARELHGAVLEVHQLVGSLIGPSAMDSGCS